MNNTIEQLRKLKNLNRQELSKLSEVPASTINKLEKGINNINGAKAITIYKIAKALNVTMEDLLNPELITEDFVKNYVKDNKERRYTKNENLNKPKLETINNKEEV